MRPLPSAFITCLIFLISAIANAATINFNPYWILKTNDGRNIKVATLSTEVDTRGETLLTFTTLTGNEGFTDLTNVANAEELSSILKSINRGETEIHLGEKPAKKNDRLATQEKTTGNIDPGFDIKSFCRSVADVSGGSYTIEEGCRKLERESKRDIRLKSIPERIYSYCLEVAEVSGGSYQIMDGCIDMELEAKGRL